ncbi:hypothetical protein [Nocardioides sp. 503]|uniref:hypothetical protein n=1 Tax=Nocardioides sp. 503 TaxID=2508326 RepID=UPI0010700317|nr:hypothetical protein [Nocardioides sp. 503]
MNTTPRTHTAPSAVRTVARTATRSAGALVLAASLGAGLAGAANASSDDDRVIRTGSCSGSTDWKIKAKEDDGRIEVEAEIDSNRTGQTWRWRLVHNGSVSAKGTSRTRGRSGSFSVERKTVDASGKDSFTFRARNPRSGERCVARVSY